MPDRPSPRIETSSIPFAFDLGSLDEGLAERLQRPPLGERVENAVYRGADAVEHFFDREVSMGAMIDGVRRYLGRIRQRR